MDQQQQQTQQQDSTEVTLATLDAIADALAIAVRRTSVQMDGRGRALVFGRPTVSMAVTAAELDALPSGDDSGPRDYALLDRFLTHRGVEFHLTVPTPGQPEGSGAPEVPEVPPLPAASVAQPAGAFVVQDTRTRLYYAEAHVECCASSWHADLAQATRFPLRSEAASLIASICASGRSGISADYLIVDTNVAAQHPVQLDIQQQRLCLCGQPSLPDRPWCSDACAVPEHAPPCKTGDAALAQTYHQQLCASETAFVNGTEAPTRWPSSGWLQAQCKGCGTSLIAKYPGSGFPQQKVLAPLPAVDSVLEMQTGDTVVVCGCGARMRLTEEMRRRIVRMNSRVEICCGPCYAANPKSPPLAFQKEDLDAIREQLGREPTAMELVKAARTYMEFVGALNGPARGQA